MRLYPSIRRASQRLNSIRFSAKDAMQLLTTLLVLSLCLFPTLAAAASPHIYDVPRTGPPGSQTTTVGNGWDPNATLDLYFDSTDVGLITTDSTGSFGMALKAPTIRQNGFAIQIPKDAVPGQHWITAVERITQIQAQVAFTVWTNNGWTQFHFGPDRTGFNPHETILSPNTVGNLAVKWQAVKGYGSSSPVLADGVVYVGGFDEASAVLYAWDSDTGAMLWKYSMGIGNWNWSSTPAVANGMVYVGSDALYALNASTGELLWKYNGGSGTPAVANGVLYYGHHTALYALNATTGFLLWKHTGNGPLDTPAVANGIVYFGTIDGDMYALNASTGAFMWSYHITAEVYSSPVVVNGVVYFDPGLYALDANTGALLWTAADCGCVDTPAVANGVVYAGNIEGWFGVGAYNAATGTLLWKYGTDSPVLASPAVANGVVYAVDWGNTYALNASTGALLWRNAIGGPYSSPAVDNGMVYVADGNGNFYAFGLPNQQMSEKLSPPERPDPARLTPDWSVQPSSQVTPPLKK
jgi:outer membrane protein assembly factor BamB